jgi:hypothetical protein
MSNTVNGKTWRELFGLFNAKQFCVICSHAPELPSVLESYPALAAAPLAHSQHSHPTESFGEIEDADHVPVVWTPSRRNGIGSEGLPIASGSD